MHCKPFESLTLQREEPQGSGSGFTSDDGFMVLGVSIQIRGTFTVFGAGDSCTGVMNFETKRSTATSWTEFASEKFAEPTTNYDHGLTEIYNVPAIFNVRLRLEYNHLEYLSSVMDIVTLSLESVGSLKLNVVKESGVLGVEVRRP